MLCQKAKTCAKYFLALLLVFCSFWLVWDLCLKFLSGSTTTLREKKQMSYLPLPNFLLCNKQRYKKDELAAMEIPKDFFDNYYPDRAKFRNKSSFPDLNATWLRATWPLTDFEIDWSRYEGMRSMSAIEICFQVCILLYLGRF